MKKLLSLVLVLLMALTAAACSSTPGETAAPAEAPAVPAEAPAAPEAPEAPAAAPEAPAEPEKTYTALGLCIKNKTGAVIDEVYIYPAGGDKGLSVVEKGWKDKAADKAGYEKNIYIVREAGAELELLVVFEDGTEASRPLGKLESYYEISLEDGKDPAAWEVELEEDADDRALMDAAVALGKTADNVYPGYELIAIELKNKTGKNIVDFRFYEEGGSAEAYNNIIDYLYTEAGEKMASLMPGKAKEGGMYLYKCFIRPHTDNYFVYVRFDDGTDITYPIEDWFKPDGDGHCPNEISLKNAEDKYDIKVQYDDGDPDPLAYLAESLAKGYVVDQWYPVYDGAPAADEAAEAARAELAKIPVPAPEEPEAPAEPAAEPEAEPAAEPAAEIEYAPLALNIKNKTGKTIDEVCIYPAGGDKGASVVEKGWPDKDADGDRYELNIYIIRPADAMMEVSVLFEDGETAVWQLDRPLQMYDKLSMKKGTDVSKWEHEPNDDADDMAKMDAVLAAGVTADGWYPAE